MFFRMHINIKGKPQLQGDWGDPTFFEDFPKVLKSKVKTQRT